WLSLRHGCRAPVGNPSRSMRRVVMFSPIIPAQRLKPRERSSSNNSACIRCTWAKVGCVPKSHKAGEGFACRALMDISFNAEGGDQRDPVRHRFAEGVGRASADCRDNAVHWRGFPQQARNNVSSTRFAPATNLSPLKVLQALLRSI